jgi:deoxyribonuclease V
VIFKTLHEWPNNPNDAIEIQKIFRPRLIAESRFEKVEYITAVDTAFNERINILYAAAVTVKYPEMTRVEHAVVSAKAQFPYIPALLSFREGPIILDALRRLARIPDIIIFAGHGIAHPRSFGIASHLGLWVDIPSIGCARKKLIGDYRDPGLEKGAQSPLYVFNSEAGLVYRSKDNVKPIFISPGYKCSLSDARDIVINCLGEYRLPEPLRRAHLLAGKIKQAATNKSHLNYNMKTPVAKRNSHAKDKSIR